MKTLRKFLMGKPEKIQRDSYFWNMISGLLNAGQSVLILMVLSRTNGQYESGIFTIAFATANLLLCIGNYGMRNYQVTDINEQFGFLDYLGSRVITGFCMVAAGVLYVVYGGYQKSYSIEKVWIVLLVILLKLIDAFEDVIYGMYQKKGRLDVGGKAYSLRLMITLISMCLGLVLTKKVILTLIITILISVISFFILVSCTLLEIPYGISSFSTSKSIGLLRACFGVFLSTFLSFYIINAPKYSIDNLLIQEEQAYFGYISMPLFVVSLLNNFLYQPILTSLALDWQEKRISQFIKRIKRQIVFILGISFIICILAFLFGIPFLSILYNSDLSIYKNAFMILILGSGIFAIVGFLTIIITIIRRQKDLVIGYIIAAFSAMIINPLLVKKYALDGAALGYTLIVSVLLVMFVLLLSFRIRSEIKSEERSQGTE